MATKPKVGGRVEWAPDGCRGTIIEVLDGGERVQVKWDTPDPDTGEDITENGIAPHISLRLL
jgi:hypothetical protein